MQSHLAWGAAGSFSLQIAATGIGFITSMLLARLLGAAGYGAYAYATALVGLLVVAGALGLPQVVVRNVAGYQARSASDLMRGLLRRANQAALVASLALALLAGVIGWVLAGRFEPQILATFWVALIMLPLRALTQIRQAAMQGLQHVVTGQLPELVLRPLLFVALLGGAYLFLPQDLNAPWVMGMQVVAAGVALVVGIGLLARRLPIVVKGASPAYQTPMWARSALPLLFIGGMQVVNHHTDIIMLGAVKGAEAAGVYTVAARGAELILFVLLAVNAGLAPAVASLYATGEMKPLQRIVTKSARAVLLFSLPVALVLIVFGRWFLLIFGPEFTRGASALAILSVGQLANAAMGSVALLLNMTGHERDTATGVGIAAVANVTLNALLIPRWGVTGAAAATATSLVIWNLLLAVLTYQRLGIHTTAVGRVRLRRGQ